MTKQEKIQILKHFRANVQRLQEQKEKSDTREQIAQATPIVLKIMSETKTLKKITISPPSMIGGLVVTVNPIENLYHVPYRMEYDVRGVALDMLDATIGVLQLEDDGEPMAKQQSDAWSIMHPEIFKVSKQRFDARLYADAVEAAFKEINTRVKEMYQQKSSNVKDGTELMYSAFSAKNPVLQFAPTSHYSEFDIQEGYMHMFAGAMQGIRNPKAHANETIDKEDALRKLAFASMLMYKLDSVM